MKTDVVRTGNWMTCDGILSIWTGLLADVDRITNSVWWCELGSFGIFKKFWKSDLRGFKMKDNSEQKFMFDTNIFDEILYEDINLDLLVNSNAEYYFTIVQRREINSIPDSKQEKKEKLLEIFKEIRMELKSIPFILGFSPLGSGSHLGGGARYKNIQKDHPDNDMNDSVMAATAINNGIIFVTKDKDLQKTIDEKYSDFCWGWEEFKKWLME